MGTFTLQQVWQSLLDTMGDDAPTQGEVMQLLNELDHKEFLLYDVVPDLPNLFRRAKKKAVDKRNTFINPFAFRIPLWNPSELLARCSTLPDLLLNRYTFMAWCVLILVGLSIMLVHWGALVAFAKSHMATARFVLIAWLSFPVVKAIHELSHALAIKKWGGDVKEVGITLFMLTPAPYVDASAANAFKSKTKRAFVSLIGIITELALAALALIVFVNAQAGFTQDIAFAIAFICSVSTLLFNGNPLLRFDAYYALTDIFSLPNLAMRSRAYWTQMVSEKLLDPKWVKPMHVATGEAKWLIGYAPLSLLYSLFIFSAIVLWLGEKSVFLGLAALTYVLVAMLIKPLIRLIKKVSSQAPAGVAQLKVKALMASLVLVLLATFFLWPLPYSTTAQGVVWVPDHARLRAQTDGVLRNINVKNRQQVALGQTILVLDNPELMVEEATLTQQLAKLEVDHYQAMLTNPQQSVMIADLIKKTQTEQARVREKIAGLTVRAGANGYLWMPNQQDQLGRYVKKGDLIGYVMDKDSVNVRVALNAQDVSMVQQDVMAVEVKTADHLDETIPAVIQQITPSTTLQLPSMALGERGGGDFITDPMDDSGLTLLQPVVLLDVNLPNTVFERAGGRAYVRFDHTPTPLAMQVYRYLKQVFISQFNAQS
jgi:putative peptide zinc metalloprotease protein